MELGSNSACFGVELIAEGNKVHCVTLTYIWKQILLIRHFTYHITELTQNHSIKEEHSFNSK